MYFRIKYLAQVAVSLLLAGANADARSLRRATTCNGDSSLCDRSYGNVSFVGAHDSYAVGTNSVSVNQDYNVTQQLNDGVRMLQLQVHNSSGTLQLCHSSCLLYNGGTLEAYLTTVKTWMDSNTEDVVSILIVNSDNLLPTEFDAVFKAAGVDTLSYSPSNSSLTFTAWPTLGQMIDSGKRLVTFLDNAANTSSVSYLIDEFTNIWETAFDVTDTSFNCDVNRTKGDTSTEMFLINHFLDKIELDTPVPDVDAANQTNAVNGTGSLGAQVATCVSDYGRPPNFMLVDFYEYGGGSVFKVAATINGVQYSPASPIATPKGTSSTTSSSSSNGGGSSLSELLSKQNHWAASIIVIGGVILGACSVV